MLGLVSHSYWGPLFASFFTASRVHLLDMPRLSVRPCPSSQALMHFSTVVAKMAEGTFFTDFRSLYQEGRVSTTRLSMSTMHNDNTLSDQTQHLIMTPRQLITSPPKCNTEWSRPLEVGGIALTDLVFNWTSYCGQLRYASHKDHKNKSPRWHREY